MAAAYRRAVAAFHPGGPKLASVLDSQPSLRLVFASSVHFCCNPACCFLGATGRKSNRGERARFSDAAHIGGDASASVYANGSRATWRRNGWRSPSRGPIRPGRTLRRKLARKGPFGTAGSAPYSVPLCVAKLPQRSGVLGKGVSQFFLSAPSAGRERVACVPRSWQLSVCI
jgi:hypothetical protein